MEWGISCSDCMIHFLCLCLVCVKCTTIDPDSTPLTQTQKPTHAHLRAGLRMCMTPHVCLYLRVCVEIISSSFSFTDQEGKNPLFNPFLSSPSQGRFYRVRVSSWRGNSIFHVDVTQERNWGLFDLDSLVLSLSRSVLRTFPPFSSKEGTTLLHWYLYLYSVTHSQSWKRGLLLLPKKQRKQSLSPIQTDSNQSFSLFCTFLRCLRWRSLDSRRRVSLFLLPRESHSPIRCSCLPATTTFLLSLPSSRGHISKTHNQPSSSEQREVLSLQSFPTNLPANNTHSPGLHLSFSLPDCLPLTRVSVSPHHAKIQSSYYYTS